MARRFIKGSIAGPGGLGRLFKTNRKLRNLSSRTKKFALGSLSKKKSGRGIDVGEEVKEIHEKWSQDTDDPISKTEADIIARELRKGDPSDKSDPKHRPTSRLAMRPPPQQDFNDDPRANLDQRPSEGTHSDDPRDPSNWQDPPPR